MNTGSKALDEFIGGYNNEITMINGKPATGKTTLALISAIFYVNQGSKVAYIDTENGFSVDRFNQLGGKNIGNILLFDVRSFDMQHKTILKINKIAKDVRLIIVDTIGMFYRLEVRKDMKAANRLMVVQLSQLNDAAKTYNLPVIITDQVYENIDEGRSKAIGGRMVSNFSKKIIELKKEDARMIILKKPGTREMKFIISNSGIAGVS